MPSASVIDRYWLHNLAAAYTPEYAYEFTLLHRQIDIFQYWLDSVFVPRKFTIYDGQNL
jgi:hypothetical protein